MALQPRGIPETARAALRQSVHGIIIEPGDADYEQARRAWNGLIDKCPAMILRCQHGADIQTGIAFHPRVAAPLAVCGGDYNVAGVGTCDNGLVLHRSPLKQCVAAPAAQCAHAEPGLTWHAFDLATSMHGLATPGGVVSITGIAEFTLGGGLGWPSRLYGMVCNNLIAAQLVTADRTIVETDDQHELDLL